MNRGINYVALYCFDEMFKSFRNAEVFMVHVVCGALVLCALLNSNHTDVLTRTNVGEGN